MAKRSEKWRERDDALNVLGEREDVEKHRDTFFARFDERRALARLITCRHGVVAGHAWHIATADPVSPLVTEGLRKRGRPPVGYELYEAVESIRTANSGKLPIRRRIAFWEPLTKAWNAGNSAEHRYVTMDGLPDWRKLRSAYKVAAKRLEPTADRMYATHRELCPTCIRREIGDLLGATLTAATTLATVLAGMRAS